jgi:hypothetical protein
LGAVSLMFEAFASCFMLLHPSAPPHFRIIRRSDHCVLGHMRVEYHSRLTEFAVFSVFDGCEAGGDKFEVSKYLPATIL